MSFGLPIKIFQSSTVGIIIIDTENLVIQFTNSRFELLSGKSNEELVGNHCGEMFSARASELVELRNEVTNCYKQDNGAMLRKAFDASWYNPCK